MYTSKYIDDITRDNKEKVAVLQEQIDDEQIQIEKRKDDLDSLESARNSLQEDVKVASSVSDKLKKLEDVRKDLSRGVPSRKLIVKFLFYEGNDECSPTCKAGYRRCF